MIWHIFKKDWKLFWPMVAGLAVVNLIQKAILSPLKPFGMVRFDPWRNISGFFGSVLLLAAAALIVIVVQQDAIPGLRQDWLVRPVRRRDLLFAKILFVVLLIQGPIFLVEVIEALGAGFSVQQSLGAPLSRSLWMLLAVDLPLLAFATLTRNLMEALGAALVVGLGFAFFTTFTLTNHETTNETAIAWVVDSMRILWSVLVVGALMALQYFRRKTIRARWIFGAAVVVWLFAQLLPWQTAFAVQEKFSPQLAAADPIQITFKPDLGKYQRQGRIRQRSTNPLKASPDIDLYVPREVMGVGEEPILKADRVTARLTGEDGRTIELGEETEAGIQDFWVVANRDYWGSHQPLWIPVSIYNRVKDQPARLEIDYSLTLFKAHGAGDVPASGGEIRSPNLGWCAARMSPEWPEVELHCLIPGDLPCPAWFLENGRGGFIVSGTPQCFNFDYAPYFGRVSDSITRFGAVFPLRVPVGLAHDQIAESQLQEARVAIRTYHPEAHFTRRLVIPNIRLSDWKAE